MDNELAMVSKEAVVEKFNALFRNLRGETRT
jgi:hypothetical protein